MEETSVQKNGGYVWFWRWVDNTKKSNVYGSMYLSVKFMIWYRTYTTNFEIFQAHKSGIYDIRWLQYIVVCISHIALSIQLPHHPSIHPFFSSSPLDCHSYQTKRKKGWLRTSCSFSLVWCCCCCVLPSTFIYLWEGVLWPDIIFYLGRCVCVCLSRTT